MSVPTLLQAVVLDDTPTDAFCSRAVVVIDRPEALADHWAAWEDLATQAIEPNIFHSPWMMLPAFRLLGEAGVVVFVLIYLPNRAGTGRLCAVFPLERRPTFRRLPFATLRLWRHPYCFLSTPLLRQGFASEALAAFLDWVSDGPWGCSLMEFGEVPEDGPFQKLLDRELGLRGATRSLSEVLPRALFRPAASSDQYMRVSLKRKRRKEIKRQGRRLGDRGEMTVRELQCGEDVRDWADQFLRLEAAGWKGRMRSALASSLATRQFFTLIMQEAFRRGRLMMFGLFIGDRPHALKCNLIDLPGSFAFKITYDETHRQLSPGLQLEIENIRRLHERTEIRWMDSCAEPDNVMINRLWQHRRFLRTTLLATGRWSGRVGLSLVPLQRLLRNLAARRFGRFADRAES